jgi:uncharacterized membrane protein (UPF0127 family)
VSLGIGAGKTESGANPRLRTLTLIAGDKTITAEVADTDASRERGLMFRPSLPWNEGMLFLFARPARASFWMRNTRIPLSIAFLDRDGTILEIYPMFPFEERRVQSRSDAVCYALEMNQGWFRKSGVKTGTRVSGLPPLE